MINILVVTHGNLAEELIKSAKMITGECDSIYALCLQPDDTIEHFVEKLESIINDLADQEILILIDMLGGTPFNTTAYLLQNNNIEGISGVNLPILIEAILTRENSTVIELADSLTNCGVQSIKNLKTSIKKSTI